jgi:hypothetical protein
MRTLSVDFMAKCVWYGSQAATLTRKVSLVLNLARIFYELCVQYMNLPLRW